MNEKMPSELLTTHEQVAAEAPRQFVRDLRLGESGFVTPDQLAGDLGRVVALALQATDRRRRRRSPLKPDHPAESMAEKA